MWNLDLFNCCSVFFLVIFIGNNTVGNIVSMLQWYLSCKVNVFEP